jgi:Outer membrane protein beta-barrel domain
VPIVLRHQNYHMNKLIVVAFIAFTSPFTLLAQPKKDTLVVGGTTIITKTDSANGRVEKRVEVKINGKDLGKIFDEEIQIFTDKNGPRRLEREFGLSIGGDKNKELKNIENSWFVLDLGFSQYNDKTNYAQTLQQGMTDIGVNKDKLKLNTISSRNVNIWILLQRLNLSKHKLNLKYGLGLELNNYRFDQSGISFQKNPTLISYTPFNEASKVKLAADYLTVPLMLNFNSTPQKNNGLRLSAGVSAGFLYSARFKTKSNGDIQKIKNDFDLEPFKFSWVGEVGFGPINLYGSFAMNNMWSKGLDMKPYNIGIRLGGRPEIEKKKSSAKKPTKFKWGATL